MISDHSALATLLRELPRPELSLVTALEKARTELNDAFTAPHRGLDPALGARLLVRTNSGLPTIAPDPKVNR